MATTFQRARSDEQRAVRTRAILETATAMLEEMPVADLSLNELSRRVGLAKSNVLRYFESREAVLLELLTGALREWLDHLAADLPTAVGRGSAFPRRAEQLADALAGSLVARPVLCDLISAQAGVLERNVSVEAIVRSKLTTLEDAEGFAALVRAALPELSAHDAWQYIIATWLMTSALWAYRRPPAALLEACAAHERLASMQLDFAGTLADHLTTLAIGLHARATG
jgi:AcrR family transcriptional regulator